MTYQVILATPAKRGLAQLPTAVAAAVIEFLPATCVSTRIGWPNR